MELKKAIEKRYSVRGYLDKSVDKDTVKNILEVAKKAPSGVNSQPWKVYVVMGNVRDNLVKEACEKFDKGEMEKEEYQVYPTERPDWYKARQRGSGFALYGALGIEKEDMDKRMKQARKNYEFFGAPHVAIITTPKDLGAYGVLDCGAFITAFTLAAAAIGVSSIPQAAIAGRAPIVREVLNIEEDRDVLCAISFGFADKDNPANSFRTQRADLGEFVEWV